MKNDQIQNETHTSNIHIKKQSLNLNSSQKIDLDYKISVGKIKTIMSLKEEFCRTTEKLKRIDFNEDIYFIYHNHQGKLGKTNEYFIKLWVSEKDMKEIINVSVKTNIDKFNELSSSTKGDILRLKEFILLKNYKKDEKKETFDIVIFCKLVSIYNTKNLKLQTNVMSKSNDFNNIANKKIENNNSNTIRNENTNDINSSTRMINMRFKKDVKENKDVKEQRQIINNNDIIDKENIKKPHYQNSNIENNRNERNDNQDKNNITFANTKQSENSFNSNNENSVIRFSTDLVSLVDDIDSKINEINIKNNVNNRTITNNISNNRNNYENNNNSNINSKNNSNLSNLINQTNQQNQMNLLNQSKNISNITNSNDYGMRLINEIEQKNRSTKKAININNEDIFINNNENDQNKYKNSRFNDQIESSFVTPKLINDDSIIYQSKDHSNINSNIRANDINRNQSFYNENRLSVTKNQHQFLSNDKRKAVSKESFTIKRKIKETNNGAEKENHMNDEFQYFISKFKVVSSYYQDVGSKNTINSKSNFSKISRFTKDFTQEVIKSLQIKPNFKYLIDLIKKEFEILLYRMFSFNNLLLKAQYFDSYIDNNSYHLGNLGSNKKLKKNSSALNNEKINYDYDKLSVIGDKSYLKKQYFSKFNELSLWTTGSDSRLLVKVYDKSRFLQGKDGSYFFFLDLIDEMCDEISAIFINYSPFKGSKVKKVQEDNNSRIYVKSDLKEEGNQLQELYDKIQVGKIYTFSNFKIDRVNCKSKKSEFDCKLKCTQYTEIVEVINIELLNRIPYKFSVDLTSMNFYKQKDKKKVDTEKSSFKIDTLIYVLEVEMRQTKKGSNYYSIIGSCLEGFKIKMNIFNDEAVAKYTIKIGSVLILKNFKIEEYNGNYSMINHFQCGIYDLTDFSYCINEYCVNYIVDFLSKLIQLFLIQAVVDIDNLDDNTNKFDFFVKFVQNISDIKAELDANSNSNINDNIKENEFEFELENEDNFMKSNMSQAYNVLLSQENKSSNSYGLIGKFKQIYSILRKINNIKTKSINNESMLNEENKMYNKIVNNYIDFNYEEISKDNDINLKKLIDFKLRKIDSYEDYVMNKQVYLSIMETLIISDNYFDWIFDENLKLDSGLYECGFIGHIISFSNYISMNAHNPQVLAENRFKYKIPCKIVKLFFNEQSVYASCLGCKKKLRMDESSSDYICFNPLCKRKEPTSIELILRYKLNVVVKDCSGMLKLSLFDASKKLLNLEPEEAINLSKTERDKIANRIEGKEYVFYIKSSVKLEDGMPKADYIVNHVENESIKSRSQSKLYQINRLLENLNN